MSYLGPRLATGAIDPRNVIGAGNWTVTFTPAILSLPADFEVFHIALRGPGGYFWLYLDDAFYSTAPRGDINEYDPTHPMFVRRGQSIIFYWSTASTPAPTVWVYCRTPTLANL